MLCFFKFFSFNWGIYSVSIELFKHFNLVIVVGPTSTLSAYTHTDCPAKRGQWWFLCSQMFRWPEGNS